MDKVTVFVGLDYHLATVQVCILNAEGRMLGNRVCTNDWREINALVRALGATDIQAGIEACTGAADLARELAEEGGWSINLAHPGYVARLKQSPDKTDFTDARLIADLVRVGYLPKVWLAPQYIRELRCVVRHRQELAQEKRNTKLRIAAALREERVRLSGNPWTKAWRAELRACPELPVQRRWVLARQLDKLEQQEQALKEVEQHLREITAEDRLVQSLLQYEGIGLVTAVTLRAEIGRFDRFRTGKQLARFSGVTPRNASSGQREADAGLIKAGNPELRRVLIEVAHRLRYFSDRWRAFGDELKRRGKPPCVIAAAIANRFLRRLYHEMKPHGLGLAA